MYALCGHGHVSAHAPRSALVGGWVVRCPDHIYKSTHFFFLAGSGGSSAASMASSNTFFNPFCKTRELMFIKDLSVDFSDIMLFCRYYSIQ